jgi:predicted SprT family Zn-dependent metalloprotease
VTARVKDMSHVIELTNRLAPGASVYFRKTGDTMPMPGAAAVCRCYLNAIVYNRAFFENVGQHIQKHVVLHECVHMYLWRKYDSLENHSDRFYETLDKWCRKFRAPSVEESEWMILDALDAKEVRFNA